MIGILHYGMGNITSVKNSLELLGIPTKLVYTPRELAGVSHIILPGVGAFSEGMKNLRALGFVPALEQEVRQRHKPFLGICLGMQLLADVGFEGGETAGLGFIPGAVRRIATTDVRIPHVGWNNITVSHANSLLTEDVDFYFVHSYIFEPRDPSTVLATVEYGDTFVAAVGQGNVYGVQFHPEKSQQSGLSVLKNFFAL